MVFLKLLQARVLWAGLPALDRYPTRNHVQTYLPDGERVDVVGGDLVCAARRGS
jgi:hypothetical protein